MPQGKFSFGLKGEKINVSKCVSKKRFYYTDKLCVSVSISLKKTTAFGENISYGHNLSKI